MFIFLKRYRTQYTDKLLAVLIKITMLKINKLQGCPYLQLLIEAKGKQNVKMFA